jgi:hypothetical protein
MDDSDLIYVLEHNTPVSTRYVAVRVYMSCKDVATGLGNALAIGEKRD